MPFAAIWMDLKIIIWRRQWHPTPVLLPGKSHGWRSLVGCSPWGRWESDTTEQLHFHFSLSCIGEGNGNPLQCSCLENPRDGGAWWAAVYGFAQSRTRLKWLSSRRSKDYHSKWSKSKEKDKYHMISLIYGVFKKREKERKWTYLQNISRVMDVGNKVTKVVGNWNYFYWCNTQQDFQRPWNSLSIYIHLCIAVMVTTINWRRVYGQRT